MAKSFIVFVTVCTSVSAAAAIFGTWAGIDAAASKIEAIAGLPNGSVLSPNAQSEVGTSSGPGTKAINSILNIAASHLEIAKDEGKTLSIKEVSDALIDQFAEKGNLSVDEARIALCKQTDGSSNSQFKFFSKDIAAVACK